MHARAGGPQLGGGLREGAGTGRGSTAGWGGDCVGARRAAVAVGVCVRVPGLSAVHGDRVGSREVEAAPNLWVRALRRD